MIAKNIKGKSFKGCVNYVMDESAELLEAEGVFTDNVKDIIRSFAMQRLGRKEIKQPVGHIPISFAPEDKHRMTNDFMIQLAKEYMQDMSIKNTQYIIIRHHNTDNDHLHIVYNRIDNNLKLISVNQDYKRNIKVCKKLKDKYNLTYGKGKDNVKRDKLANPDKVKYYIYDAIRATIVSSPNYETLEKLLKLYGVSMQFKLRRGTDIVEGVSFCKNGCSFKGSQVDRLFSHKKLSAMMNMVRQHQEEVRQQKQQPRTPKIFGQRLTVEQNERLKKEGFVFLENMTNSKGKSFAGYVFSDDTQSRYFALKNRPDEFIKYGHYEMRRMDKWLIEAGCVTHATVKWYDGKLAHPYLWKPDAVKDEAVAKLSDYTLVDNSDYCQSWSDPRIPNKEQSQAMPIPNNTGQTTNESALSQSLSDIGNSTANALSEDASALGGLFDMQPSQAEDEQQPTLAKKKSKKQKKRGRSL